MLASESERVDAEADLIERASLDFPRVYAIKQNTHMQPLWTLLGLSSRANSSLNTTLVPKDAPCRIQVAKSAEIILPCLTRRLKMFHSATSSPH